MVRLLSKNDHRTVYTSTSVKKSGFETNARQTSLEHWFTVSFFRDPSQKLLEECQIVKSKKYFQVV